MFAHLHIHSEYSVLDGACKVEELIETVKNYKQPAVCITDHGSTSSWWTAQQLGKKLGVKILLGTEFYYERENDGKNGHLIAIAKNNKGIENIFKLQEYSYVENFYYKPRINFDILEKHHEGLIVTSACLASTFNQYILSGESLKAQIWAKKFRNLFGDDFYLEVQANSLQEQLEANKVTMRIANDLGIKVIASNDVHYIHQQDAFTHEVLLAIQVNKKMSDESRFCFTTQDFWLKTEEEMFNTLPGLSDEQKIAALNNTIEIVNKCNAEIVQDKYLPKFYNIPEGLTERNVLAQEIMKGAKVKGFAHNREYMQQVQNELDVIDRNGYSGYFLIVQDYVTTARKNGIIVGDGRGSGAGSKVAYLTDITRIEPSKYDLLFERFMADGREPDFDVDFSDQDAVFKDLQSKYGEDNVARIIAFGTLTPKACCRKVLSTFEHDTQSINAISKLIGDAATMAEAYEQSPQLLDYKKQHQLEFQVIERLEGLVSHESQHAGGVIIYPNLSSLLPIKTKADDRSKRIVAFDKYMLEDIGHFKFDILGLETLPLIKRCLDSIDDDIDLYNIDYDDPKVYEQLCNGNVSGVFQLSNQAQKVIQQQPRNFKDLIAINALIRPGTGDWEEYIARRKGKEWSVHEARMPYLRETEGLITYQEQFLLDCKTLAGWDIAFADKKVRKNKDIRNDTELREKFIHDCLNHQVINSYDESVKVWNEIVDAVAGGYSFNKSHSASYAMLSFQTAWLKTYYPVHFYASLMSSEKTDGDGQDAIAKYIAECKQLGINILPPDINNSNDNFVVVDNSINYRITAIKHVGASAVNAIISMRPIKSFQDFLERREKQFLKKNVVVSLIKAGCFDFDNPNRAELLWQFLMSERTKTQIKENYQFEKLDWNDKVKAQWEKEVLGLYLSAHPMEKYGFKPLDTFIDGDKALQGGEIIDIKIIKDKHNREMAFVFLETLFGRIKVIIFSSTWSDPLIKQHIHIGNTIMVKGKRSGDSIILFETELLN